MGHPAHVHLFKNAIREFQNKGHQTLVTARDKEVAIDLLKAYSIEHIVVGKIGSNKMDLIREWIVRDYEILKIARKFDPDILMGMSNPCAAHVSRILGKKSILMDDTEHASFTHKITYPFANVICTPTCYKKDLGKKQVRYDGYHELAYLHPNYFTPNPSALEFFGLKEDDAYIVLRFVSWGANHDVGHNGLSLEDKRKAVHTLEKYGKVLITSEQKLPEDLEKYRMSAPPEKIHDLLFYATLLYGESATMASECAVLGTHSIFCDYAGRGYTDEEEKYGLVYNFYDELTMGSESLRKAEELLKNPNLRKEGKIKRDKLLKEKIDVTKFIVDFVENYYQKHRL